MKAKILVGKHKNKIAKVIKIDNHKLTPVKVKLDNIILRFHAGEVQILKECI